ALRERFRHRLAVHLRQLRLGVERLQVRRPAGHVQPDDSLDLWDDVWRIDDAGSGGGFEQRGIEERRQGQGTEAAGGSAEEGSAGEVHRGWCARSHEDNHIAPGPPFSPPECLLVRFLGDRIVVKNWCEPPRRRWFAPSQGVSVIFLSYPDSSSGHGPEGV